MVGDRARNNRPEKNDPVMPDRLFFINRVTELEMPGFRYRTPDLGMRLNNRRSVSVPNLTGVQVSQVYVISMWRTA